MQCAKGFVQALVFHPPNDPQSVSGTSQKEEPEAWQEVAW